MHDEKSGPVEVVAAQKDAQMRKLHGFNDTSKFGGCIVFGCDYSWDSVLRSLLMHNASTVHEILRFMQDEHVLGYLCIAFLGFLCVFLRFGNARPSSISS